MNEEIIKLIEGRKLTYSKDQMRVELLKRNKIFLEELENIFEYIKRILYELKLLTSEELSAISRYRVLKILNDNTDKFDIEKTFGNIKNSMFCDPKILLNDALMSHKIPNGTLSLQIKNPKLGKLKSIWESFCYKWHIDSEWDANIESVGSYQRALLEIVVDPVKTNPLPIIIKAGPWTTQKDIKEKWPEIERIQKELKKEEVTASFARDLCWYDLNKKLSLKPRAIAEIWDEKYPEDIDILVLRHVKDDINKQDLKGRALKDSELLAEIKSGVLKDKYKADFEIIKEEYVTGRSVSTQKKFNPPFVDVIKKSIKRMQKRIDELAPSSRNQDLKQVE